MPKLNSHKVAYVRFLPPLDKRLKEMETALGLTRCAVIRLAIERGLPVLEEQLNPPTPAKP